MSEGNIWRQGPRRETAALEVITAALEAGPDHHARRDGTSATGTNPGAAGPCRPRRRGHRPHQPSRRPHS
jgi:hypothetical protein